MDRSIESKGKKIGSFILWYLPVLLVQLVSGSVTANSLNPWYKNLIKPSWNPPSWVFGPAWTLLYIMMTLSVWLIYRSEISSNVRKTAYTLFFFQLALNALWSILFFGEHAIGWALLDLGLLVVSVGITAVYFYRIRPVAGLLLIPYLLWILYAFSLNAALYALN